VRGWAASGDANAAREAGRYFDELADRFPLTPASCVAILDACAGPLALPIARRVLAAARARGAAEAPVLAAGLRALASGRAVAEAADWVAELVEETETLDACLLPGLVDACAAAGSWARGRQVVSGCADPAVLDRFLRHAARENWAAATGPTSARGAALGALEDAAARGFAAGPAPYTRAMEALVRAGDRGVAEQLFAQAVARGCADLHAFHARISASTWPELAPEEADDDAACPVLDSIRAAGLIPTAKTFAMLVAKAADHNRAAAWALVEAAEAEVELDAAVLRPVVQDVGRTVAALRRVDDEAVGAELGEALIAAARSPAAVAQCLEVLPKNCVSAAKLAEWFGAADGARARALLPLLDSATSEPRVNAVRALLKAGDASSARSAAGDDAAALAAMVLALLGDQQVLSAADLASDVDSTSGLDSHTRMQVMTALAKAGDAARAARFLAAWPGDSAPASALETVAIAHCVAGDGAAAAAVAARLRERTGTVPRRLLNAQLDCAARTGDEAAAEILLRDLKATPGSVTVMTLASLVRLAGQAGNPDLAERYVAEFAATYNVHPNDLVRGELARAHARGGDFAKGRALLESMATPEPRIVRAVVVAGLKSGDAAARSLAAKHGVSLQDAGDDAAPAQRPPASFPKRPAQTWRANVVA